MINLIQNNNKFNEYNQLNKIIFFQITLKPIFEFSFNLISIF